MRTGPLSALLSQVLVAYTIEFDGEFELRMGEAGYPGAILSLVVWSDLMRFLAPGDHSVRDLVAKAPAPGNQIYGELGCLERWGFVALHGDRPIPQRPHSRTGRLLRDGWGSGRGIRLDWTIGLTEKGRKAVEIWPPLFPEIERRWNARFGAVAIANLRHALEEVAPQSDGPLPLPTLLSQALAAFAAEFDRESKTPLSLCANTIRVLGDTPIPAAEIPRLTGTSPETSAIGWQLKPYVIEESDPAAARGKVVRLTPLGIRVQHKYRVLAGEIEARWEERFGADKVRRLRECLNGLFERLPEGLIPPKGTVRSGELRPALGRRAVAAAARQRARDMVAQTERFVADAVNALPHYPLWDMNRGFGP